MAATPELGKNAPDFTLPGLVFDGKSTQTSEYTLSAHGDGPLVLAFYPGDGTAMCTKQMCSYSAGLDRFADLGAAVWGVSPQNLDSHEEFAKKNDLRMPLLADTDRSVARQYGIAMPGLGLRRSVFLIDGKGLLRWKHITRLGLSYQPLEALTTQIGFLYAS